MTSVVFSELDRNDLCEFHRLFNSNKRNDIDTIISSCIARGISPHELFKELYIKHNIKQIKDREGAARRLHNAVPCANINEIESILRRCEMIGLTESDALEILRDRFINNNIITNNNTNTNNNINNNNHKEEKETKVVESKLQPKTTVLHDISTNNNTNNNNNNNNSETHIRGRPLSSGPTRAAMDEIMAAECCDWVAQVVGDNYNTELLQFQNNNNNNNNNNFVDALRSGVILLILLQKLRNPPVPDAELKIPKRITGFYARDNVISFLKEAASTFNLVEAQLFTDSDLCDGKNDRAVITCLLAIARIAYTRGNTKLAPAMIKYEQEIEAKIRNVTQQQIEEMLKSVEDSETNSDNNNNDDDRDENIMNNDNNCDENNNTNNNKREQEEEEEQKEIFLLNSPKSHEEETPVELEKQEGTKDANKDNNNDNNNKTKSQSNDENFSSEEKKMNKEENQETLGNIEKKKTEEKEKEGNDIITPEKKSGAIFYLRKGAIVKDPNEVPVAPLTPPKLSEIITTKNSNNNNNNNNNNNTEVNPGPPKYRSRRWDEIDTLLGIIVNTHFLLNPNSQVRFRRLSATSGEYVVYHRTRGHKRILYARILQGKLMIRPFDANGKSYNNKNNNNNNNNSESSIGIGGGVSSWVELKHWLERYEEENPP